MDRNHVPMMSFSSCVFVVKFNLSQTREQKNKQPYHIHFLISEDGK